MEQTIMTFSFVCIGIIGATIGATGGGILGYWLGKHLTLITHENPVVAIRADATDATKIETS